MCLKVQSIPPIPEQTKQVAEAAFPKGNRCLRIRQVFDGIFKDDEFEAYYPPQGQPGYSPWRLALVSVMQYIETTKMWGLGHNFRFPESLKST